MLFSKNLDNHKAACALHFAYYNFCRIHKSLRVTPAMEAEIADHVWGLAELMKWMAERIPTLIVANGWQRSLGGLGTRTPLVQLGQGRITAIVRVALRQRYRKEGVRVVVSNNPEFRNEEWIGQCKLDNERLTYRITAATQP
jgi:hypothetical protein